MVWAQDAPRPPDVSERALVAWLTDPEGNVLSLIQTPI